MPAMEPRSPVRSTAAHSPWSNWPSWPRLRRDWGSDGHTGSFAVVPSFCTFACVANGTWRPGGRRLWRASRCRRGRVYSASILSGSGECHGRPTLFPRRLRRVRCPKRPLIYRVHAVPRVIRGTSVEAGWPTSRGKRDVLVPGHDSGGSPIAFKHMPQPWPSHFRRHRP